MLRQRVITALVLLALLLPALFAASALPFALFTLVLISAAGWEWARLNGVKAALPALATGALVALMDTVPVLEGVDVKLVRLEHADAANVSQTLTAIFMQGQRLGTRASRQVQGRQPAGGCARHALRRP